MQFFGGLSGALCLNASKDHFLVQASQEKRLKTLVHLTNLGRSLVGSGPKNRRTGRPLGRMVLLRAFPEVCDLIREVVWDLNDGGAEIPGWFTGADSADSQGRMLESLGKSDQSRALTPAKRSTRSSPPARDC